MGSYLYAASITLVYGKKGQHSPHEPSILPIDGRVTFIVGGFLCFALSSFVKYYVEYKGNAPKSLAEGEKSEELNTELNVEI